jgi:hypothetical protein
LVDGLRFRLRYDAVVVVGSLTMRRVTLRTLPGGQRRTHTETTEYVQSDRKREEHRGVTGYRLTNTWDIYRPNPRTALITRGDLQKTFLVNFEDREFTEWPIRPFPTREELIGRVQVEPPPPPPGPNVRVETETVDTGERKQFFGREARHVITTRRVTWLAEPNRENRQTLIDGWYIDLDTSVSCEPWWWSERSGHAFAYATVHREGDPRTPAVRPIFEDIGEPERGYVVQSRTTEAESICELEVIELSTAPLDSALFDVPIGFVRVEQIRQHPVPPLVIRLQQTYERVRRGLARGAP